jgi:phage shock protein E
MGILSFLGLGNGKIKDALRKGAVIIDVRNVNEYDQGRIPDSVNIPVDKIAANAERIRQMNRPVIFCCASGSGSSQAMQIMKGKGLKDVYNGGSWTHLLKLVKNTL